MLHKNIIVLIATFFVVTSSMAQEGESKWEFDMSGGVKVGGAAPLSIPKEIRDIQSYGLGGLPLFIKINTEYKVNPTWGIRTGLVLEGKGMYAKAGVKGYKTTFNGADDPSQNVRGYYYGDITTKVDNIYLTVPLQVTYQLSNRWDLQFGPYLSYALSRRFYGEAIEGYMRSETPTGEKVGVSNVAYNFDSSIRKYDVGASLGARYGFGSGFHVLGQFDYGFNSIMNTGFESISFGLHNIYMNIGVGFRL
ncbi:MAG: PorT family protein [Sphingobacterium sp.]|jgi:hypothetical protein|nr:PorT family protein [Sphingobacterium sp.]